MCQSNSVFSLAKQSTLQTLFAKSLPMQNDHSVSAEDLLLDLIPHPNYPVKPPTINSGKICTFEPKTMLLKMAEIILLFDVL